MISKNLWNTLLQKTKEKYETEKKFYSKAELDAMAKRTGLYAQTAQALSHRLYIAIIRKISAKKHGVSVGFPRFKSVDRMKSLHYPQSGFSLGEKLKVTPFGWIQLIQHRQIKGKIKTLTLKRESSGKWFALFCVEEEKEELRINNGPMVGIDLGLKKFATLSDTSTIENPRHFSKWQTRLAIMQRALSKKKKGSKNRQKAKLKVVRIHEKISNVRSDFLHKTANFLLSKYSLIALENLNVNWLAQNGNGKGINDASWFKFANILAYKAERAGCRLIFVNPKDTSKECSACGTIVEKTLWQRQHICHNCGLSIDRDLNASKNILIRATAGHAESNACGDLQNKI